jgi:fatty acid desaturase
MIITRDTHAASHYAWSYNATINQWMYRICMAYAGSSPAQWTSKHVIAHHISTNISPIDDDTMYVHVFVGTVTPLRRSFGCTICSHAMLF